MGRTSGTRCSGSCSPGSASPGSSCASAATCVSAARSWRKPRSLSRLRPACEDLRMDLGLADRVFLVTAASSGLGRATAERLVAEGAKVALVARRAEVLAEVVGALGEANAVACPADLADPDTAQTAC